MKILLGVPQFPPLHIGGAELLAQRMAKWLIRQGHHVQVVCVGNAADPERKGELAVREETYQGIPVQRLYFNWWHTPDSLEWTFNNPLITAHFETLLRAQRYDVLHLISGYLLGVGPLRAARQYGIPTVITLTDFWFCCPSLQFLRADGALCQHPEPAECLHCLFVADRRARIPAWTIPHLTRPAVALAAHSPSLAQKFDLPARRCALTQRSSFVMAELNAASAVITLTDFVAKLHAANGMHTVHLTVIPDCTDLAEFDRTTHTGADEPVIRFGYLGQVLPIKGVDVLIRAFRQLDRSARRARLTIHGPLNGDANYVRQLRQLAGNDPDIVFAGGYAHREALKILNALDVVVVPSRWYENSPRVILEAFAAARPVIATNLGGLTEIVRAEENGLLFERDNVNDLARQMQRLVNNPELIGRLRTRIPPIRGMNEYMNDLMQVYRRVTYASVAVRS